MSLAEMKQQREAASPREPQPTPRGGPPTKVCSYRLCQLDTNAAGASWTLMLVCGQNAAHESEAGLQQVRAAVSRVPQLHLGSGS